MIETRNVDFFSSGRLVSELAIYLSYANLLLVHFSKSASLILLPFPFVPFHPLHEVYHFIRNVKYKYLKLKGKLFLTLVGIQGLLFCFEL